MEMMKMRTFFGHVTIRHEFGQCLSVLVMAEDIIPPDSLSLPFPDVLGPMVVYFPTTRVVSASEDNILYPP